MSGGLDLGDRRVLFVGGKGGVGKTTVASALALHLSEAGDRCLLVSTDPAHSLGDLWGREMGDRETRLGSDLWGMEIDPDSEVDRHLATVARAMHDFARPELRPELDRQLKLARLSPGAVEAAMFERIADLMIEYLDRFDRIVFDTAPTGHTLRLLSLPEIMAAWTDGLLRQRQRVDSWDAALKRLRTGERAGEDLAFVDSEADREQERAQRIRSILLQRRRKLSRAREILLDPDLSGFILVLNPEKLPIAESRKAVASLKEFDVPVLGLVVNRVLPDEPLGDFLEQRRAQESVYLGTIDEAFHDLDRIRVPLLPHDVVERDALRAVGAALFPP